MRGKMSGGLLFAAALTFWADGGSASVAPGAPAVIRSDRGVPMTPARAGNDGGGTPTPTATAPGTPPPTRTPTATPNPTDAACVGNCNGDGVVSVNELVAGVNIALGAAALGTCPAFDHNSDGRVTVNELISAVNNLLYGCGVAPPTPRPTPTPTATSAATPTATETSTAVASTTRTATRTRSPVPTKTQTPTPTAAVSVCGGFVASVPVLCNLTVIPNPVSRSGTIAFRFGVSDLDGDINRICLELTYPLLEPQTTCTQLQPTNHPINGSVMTNPGPASVLQFGTYTAAMQAFDAAGHQSNVITTTFQVQ